MRGLRRPIELSRDDSKLILTAVPCGTYKERSSPKLGEVARILKANNISIFEKTNIGIFFYSKIFVQEPNVVDLKENQSDRNMKHINLKYGERSNTEIDPSRSSGLTSGGLRHHRRFNNSLDANTPEPGVLEHWQSQSKFSLLNSPRQSKNFKLSHPSQLSARGPRDIPSTTVDQFFIPHLGLTFDQ